MTAVGVLILVAFAAAGTQIDIAPVLGILLGGGATAVVTAWVMLRRAGTDRTATRATTAQTLTDATEKWSEYVDDKLDDVLDENRKLREERLAQRAEIAMAIAAQAAAEASAARAEAERSRERHELQSDVAARDTKIALQVQQIVALQAEIVALQAEIAALRAHEGIVGRRRSEL